MSGAAARLPPTGDDCKLARSGLVRTDLTMGFDLTDSDRQFCSLLYLWCGKISYGAI